LISSVVATNNHLILAVAGSRKTQGIVDDCVAADKAERILILTYTTANQIELRNRLATVAGDHPNVEVSGWFSFLLGHFVRPFLPFLYWGRRLRGFDFKSPPQTYSNVEDWSRYFNEHEEARKVHLPQLAARVEDLSVGAAVRRLERIYDRIFIDEVQDLCGYDLEILILLMASRLPVEMVGDIRQAILATNEREAKNKKFMFMRIWGVGDA
jgi:DNA helicase-2/ATP-dependent DNA helicase PcrA